ncbi:N-acetylmuramoyl-L-alanine amidase [Litorisediminicola beolgyonensis]|uniref:N-acetylmuramoyl-L-alanine amidase n=1 Tax=Litorisediminicola beolgyonensis TaxID=1173614 RepID=A0ABW3ZGN4_9RHOB
MLHYTAMASAAAACEWLCAEKAQVSAHYVIAEDGRSWQLVEEDQRAWHAGTGQWGEITDMNSRSIGIELANTGAHPFPEPQMAALETLLRAIRDRHAIPPGRVIGHSDFAIGRKIDPGPRFDWARLARRGLALDPIPAEPQPITASAHAAGYRWQDGQEDALLQALRFRLRPGHEGPEDDTDRRLAAGFAAALRAGG